MIIAMIISMVFVATWGIYKLGYYWTYFVLYNDMESGCTYYQVKNYTSQNIERSKWNCISNDYRTNRIGSMCHNNTLMGCWIFGDTVILSFTIISLIGMGIYYLIAAILGCCIDMKSAYTEVSDELISIEIQKDN